MSNPRWLCYLVLIYVSISSTTILQAQTTTAEMIRQAIFDPNCVASCFLGIQPGITPTAELVALLDAQQWSYKKNQLPWDDQYFYTVTWPTDDPRFPFIDQVIFNIWPFYYTENDYDTVSGITLMTTAIPLDIALSVFPDPPDRIGRGSGKVLLYEDEQVTLVLNSSDSDTAISDIHLNSAQGMDIALVFEEDLRPCAEPVDLCRIPRLRAVVGFELQGNPIPDVRLGVDNEIPYQPNLEIVAQTNPEQVGSVVFTVGETTIIDNTAPYTWIVPHEGRHHLRARPYSEADGQGIPGTSLTLDLKVPAAATIIRYQYAYRVNERATEFHLVDPEKPTQPPMVRHLPTGTTLPYLPASTALSPNGEMLLVVGFDATRQEQLLQLWHIMTDDLQVIARYPKVIPTIDHLAWSPDSAYVAYQLVAPDQQSAILEVYSVVRNEVVHLYEHTPQAAPLYDLSWSPNSEQLGLSITECQPATCQPTIWRIYHLPTGNLSTTMVFSSPTDPNLRSPCNFQWSPNGLYLIFTTNCAEGSLIQQDLYLWDLLQHTLLPISLPSETTAASSRDSFTNRYHYVWLDNEQLLMSYLYISASAEVDSATFQMRTILYFLTNHSLPVEQWDPLDWTELTRQPNGSEIAYVTRRYGWDEQQTLRSNYLEVNISSFIGGSRSNNFSGKLGCGLVWSPDERYLAYHIIPYTANTPRVCTTMIGYAFRDLVESDGGEFLLPEPLTADVLGWIRVPPTWP